MKTFLIALSLTVAAPAYADDTLLVDVCKRAAAHFYVVPKGQNLVTREVQDFSNLSPPRVRMAINGVVSCTFTSATRPVGLREFCAAPLTAPAAGDPPCIKAGQRFDELVELLRREGF